MRRTRPEMVQSFEGVKLALNLLNDYYATADKSHSVFFDGASGTVRWAHPSSLVLFSLLLAAQICKVVHIPAALRLLQEGENDDSHGSASRSFC